MHRSNELAVSEVTPASPLDEFGGLIVRIVKRGPRKPEAVKMRRDTAMDFVDIDVRYSVGEIIDGIKSALVPLLNKRMQEPRDEQPGTPAPNYKINGDGAVPIEIGMRVMDLNGPGDPATGIVVARGENGVCVRHDGGGGMEAGTLGITEWDSLAICAATVSRSPQPHRRRRRVSSPAR
jgi:hypothetical protein